MICVKNCVMIYVMFCRQTALISRLIILMRILCRLERSSELCCVVIQELLWDSLLVPNAWLFIVFYVQFSKNAWLQNYVTMEEFVGTIVVTAQTLIIMDYDVKEVIKNG